MPTYYARNTAIQLSVADLAKTTATYPKSTQGPAMFEQVSANSLEFMKASQDGTLNETPLKDKGVSSSLQFLGSYNDMPFLMVRAGEHYFDINTDEKRNRRPIRMPMPKMSQANVTNGMSTLQVFGSEPTANSVADDDAEVRDLASYQAIIDEHRRKPCAPPVVPHALCLTVFLSKDSFLRSYGEKGKRFNDVKIDIFLNGQFSASAYVPERWRADAHNLTDHIIRFSGCRVGRVLEKPWVMVPPGQTPDGHLRRGRGACLGAKQRWTSVSDALVKEAGKLERDKNGELSVLRNYLDSLAKLDMPSEVDEMQKRGGPKFGVIDVVIITGKGHKDEAGHPFLLKPTPIRSIRPKINIQERIVTSHRRNVDPSEPEGQNLDSVEMNTSELPTRASVRSRQATSEKPKRTKQKANSTENADLITQRSFNSVLKLRTQKALSPSTKTQTTLGHSTKRTLDNYNFEASSLPTGLPIVKRCLRSISQGITTKVPKALSLKNAGFKDSPTTDLKQLVGLRRTRNSTGVLPLSADNIVNNKRRRVTLSPHLSTSDSMLPVKSKTDKARFLQRHFQTSVISNLDPNVGQKSYKGFSAKQDASQPKRGRYNYEIVLDDKMTLAEEIESITTEAGKAEAATGPSRVPRITRLSLTNTETDTPLSGVKPTSIGEKGDAEDNKSGETTRASILKLSAPKPPGSLQTSSSSRSSNTPNTPNQSPFLPTFNLVPPEMPPTSPPENLPPTPCPPRASAILPTEPSTMNESLSDDSVLTYAPEGILRQIKGERGGWFEEEGVIMGVRFLVG